MDPDVTAYLESWTREFSARADRIRNLIGSKHWLSDGNHKEEILREFLKRYLPRNIDVTRGFVRSTVDDIEISGELDVLLADFTRGPPLLREAGMTICAPMSVCGYIEVKSDFNATTIKDALVHLVEAQCVIDTQSSTAPVWRSAFFFNATGSDSSDGYIRTLETGITNSLLRFRENCAISDLEIQAKFPNCISVIGKFVAFLNGENGSIRIRYFDTREQSAAFALIDLFGAISTRKLQPQVNHFEDFASVVQVPAPIISTVAID
mgnify:CR=1 FL=1|jgi:hypothetical protein